MYTFFLNHTKKDLEMLYSNEALEQLQRIGKVMLNPLDRPLTTAELIELSSQANFIITTVRAEGSKELFENSPNLISFIRAGVDLRNVNLESAAREGILVCNCPGIYEAPVVELVIGYLCCISRDIIKQNNRLKNGEVDRYTSPDLWGKVLGLVGYGAIAKRVAKAAKTLGMKILVYDPFVKQVDEGEKLCTEEELYSTADFVSLHAVLNKDTEGLIGEKELSLMKPTAWLINTARGLLIQEEILYQYLVEGKIAGAALDVFATEPNIQNSPLIQLDNVIVTPHIGGWSSRVYKEISLKTVELVQKMIAGEMPETTVNKNLLGQNNRLNR